MNKLLQKLNMIIKVNTRGETLEDFKGSSDPSHFTSIFEINVGKRRIRHTTTLKLNGEFQDRLKID